MRLLAASMILALGAGAAGAQLVPLGAPIMAQPKTRVATPPSSSQLSTGRMRAAAPLGSNYSPYSIQPQASVTAAAPSALPEEKPVASGVVNDPNALAKLPDTLQPTTKPGAPRQQSDMQKLGPQAAQRTEMPTADAPDPH